ncbi:dienelactone hydrolase family protein [Enhygromyxa salina]|uniref:Putative phosphoribosyl transferase n=1 Tax=Enhygromyxa salina TaxID=215803 RepID=A0A2S9YY09_9BACT|nr:alpha/beta family hydrolase [Enhygromyxa salina]PRQ09985.1 putative phosphoribosyl transferase [Enhygromyxa salina]
MKRTITSVTVQSGEVELEGDLTLVPGAGGIVVFAHGSGSSRFSSRNRHVASKLTQRGLSTLLFDLLTPNEHTVDELTRELRFDIALLGHRLIGTIDWLQQRSQTQALRIGLFGASTGAAAALVAAAERPFEVGAVVSRGGRPDLAAAYLPRVQAPTLLLVGELDEPVISMNRQAAAALRCEHELQIVPGASHLFEEPGKLEIVAELAREWFVTRLG